MNDIICLANKRRQREQIQMTRNKAAQIKRVPVVNIERKRIINIGGVCYHLLPTQPERFA